MLNFFYSSVKTLDNDNVHDNMKVNMNMKMIYKYI